MDIGKLGVWAPEITARDPLVTCCWLLAQTNRLNLATGIVSIWGDEKAIRDRIRQHFEAGADHLCIQPLRRGTRLLTADDEKVLELLAPG